MRSMTYLAGLLGFAAIASAVAETPVHHLSPNPTKKQLEDGAKPYQEFNGDYTFHPGAHGEAVRTISVKRQFKYIFPGAKPMVKSKRQVIVDEKNNPLLAPDADSRVIQYVNPAKIQQYLNDPYIPQYFKDLLANLHGAWVIDCRTVAERMVESLIFYRIQVDKSRKSMDRESRYYQERADTSDIPFIAKHLDTILITPAQVSEKNPEGKPWYSCKTKVVDGEDARCGELWITFKALPPATTGPYEGQRASFFQPEACLGFLGQMKFEACELLSQVSACGLRDIQSAWAGYADNPATQGLADKLELFAKEEHDARAEGTYVPRASESHDQGGAPYTPFALPHATGTR